MFMHKIIIIIFASLTAGLAQAAVVCPSVDILKQSNAQQWLALNFNSDEPATPEDIDDFLKTLRGFTDAVWSEDYEYGYGRCYYDSDAEVYIASYHNPVPTRPTLRPWVWDGRIARCS